MLLWLNPEKATKQMMSIFSSEFSFIITCPRALTNPGRRFKFGLRYFFFGRLTHASHLTLDVYKNMALQGLFKKEEKAERWKDDPFQLQWNGLWKLRVSRVKPMTHSVQWQPYWMASFSSQTGNCPPAKICPPQITRMRGLSFFGSNSADIGHNGRRHQSRKRW